MRIVWLLPLFLLTGCEAQVCALIGQYVGSFEGDAQGQLDATIEEDPESKDDVQVTFVLTGETSGFTGNAVVSCSDGELVLDLSDIETGEAAGTVTGILGAGDGSGDYKIGDLIGTWSYGE